MTVSSFLHRFLRFMSEPFYYYQWTGWKVFAIAMPVLLLLSLIIIWRQKTRARRADIHDAPTLEPPHVIGAKLVQRKQNHEEIADIRKDRSANIRGKRGKHQNWKETTGRFEKLNREIDHLQHEIAKHEQTEAQLDQKVAELAPSNERLQTELANSKQIEAQFNQRIACLTAYNEQLQQELAKKKQIEMQVSQEIAELTACNEQLQQGTNETTDAERYLEQQLAESQATNEQLQQEVAENKQIEIQLSQEIAELTACNKQLQQGTSETTDAERYLEQQLAESQATNEQLKSRIAKSEQIEEALKLTARLGATDALTPLGGMLEKSPQQIGSSNQSEKPLDVETLQAIATLIKQIQARPAQN